MTTLVEAAPREQVLVFGQAAGLEVFLPTARRQRGMLGVLTRASSIGALVLDARAPIDFVRACELLRALYDDPRGVPSLLPPTRILAVIAAHDLEAAFAFGRYGLGGVLGDDALEQLAPRVQRLTRRAIPPTLAPPVLPRSMRLSARPATSSDLPTVAIGYRHAPETLEALERYRRVLEACSAECSVFADVAVLIDVMVREGLTCQTTLATKAGATDTGQFIGSFAFYRELRRTRYGRIPDPPAGLIEMDVFIAVDEVIHEILHLLFLANHLRAGIEPENTLFAEELSLTWWQAAIHQRVFPQWLCDPAILEINDDFLLVEANAEPRGFWKKGAVFSRYAAYPWVAQVLAQLPRRESYIGERPDLMPLIAAYAARPEAQFLVPEAPTRLSITVPFGRYPEVPATLAVASLPFSNRAQ